ncbi:hypothetical protein [Geobacillus kaustophilus]|uniref:hypothetical protein n=1 Tax=Geobacillus kaustophilus TaxID=1462 RepID=UPI00399C694A
MIDSFLDFMLGDLRTITDLYIRHQLVFNSIVVGAALLKLIISKKETDSRVNGEGAQGESIESLRHSRFKV